MCLESARNEVSTPGRTGHFCFVTKQTATAEKNCKRGLLSERNLNGMCKKSETRCLRGAGGIQSATGEYVFGNNRRNGLIIAAAEVEKAVAGERR